MKIRIAKDIDVPAGMYCTGCNQLKIDLPPAKSDRARMYCSEFNGRYLGETKDRRGIKCKECLLACRLALIEL